LAIEPVSFSRTTPIVAMMAGININISMITLGTMAFTLSNAWL
jgi:hypothetical protein